MGRGIVAIGLSGCMGGVVASPPAPSGVQLAMFFDNAPTARTIADVEARIGKELASVHWFTDWSAVDGCARQPCSDGEAFRQAVDAPNILSTPDPFPPVP